MLLIVCSLFKTNSFIKIEHENKFIVSDVLTALNPTQDGQHVWRLTHEKKNNIFHLGIKPNIPIFMAAAINILEISRGKKQKSK